MKEPGGGGRFHRVMHSGLLILLWIGAALSAFAGPRDLPGWKLVWNDEFTGRSIDSSKWKACERGGSDWNDTMSADPKCFALKNGVLELRGFANPDRKKDAVEYLTGGITSQGKFDFTYGKVVIRARFKSATGAWPDRGCSARKVVGRTTARST